MMLTCHKSVLSCDIGGSLLNLKSSNIQVFLIPTVVVLFAERQ